MRDTVSSYRALVNDTAESEIGVDARITEEREELFQHFLLVARNLGMLMSTARELKRREDRLEMDTMKLEKYLREEKAKNGGMGQI